MSDSDSEEEAEEEDFKANEWPVWGAGWNGRKQLGLRSTDIIKRRKQWKWPMGTPIDRVAVKASEKILKNIDTAATLPVPISYFDSNFRIGSIACGENHTLITDATTGCLYSMGSNDLGQCGHRSLKRDLLCKKVAIDETFVLAVAAGNTSSYYISGKRQVYAWGDNRLGQLGLGVEMFEEDGNKQEEKVETKKRNLERRIVRVPQLIKGLENWRIKQVVAGNAHVLALTVTGSLYSWGENGSGQLGLGDKERRWNPCLVVHMNGCRIVCVAACGDHSACAGDTKLAHHLDEVGNLPNPERAVFHWGRPMIFEQRKDNDSNDTIPTVSLRKKAISQLALGEAHVLALEGTSQLVYSWGDNQYGQLGVGDNYERLKPVKIEGLSNIQKIAAGKRHSVAVQSSGICYAWGRNLCGENGLGDFDCRLSPEAIKHLSQVNICEIACSATCTIFGATIPSEEEATSFGNEVFRHPQILTINDDLTAIRKAEADGYSYIALAGPAVERGTFKWEVTLDRSMSAEFDVGIGVASPETCGPYNYVFDPFDQGPTWLYLQSGQKSNMGDSDDYGEPYFQGDVIGVEVDMDIGTLRFYRRGKDLGVAYYLTSTKYPLFLCVSLPGETDQVSLQLPEDNDYSNNVTVDVGTLLCHNDIGLDKTTGMEVFYKCQPCNKRLCRACARQCHGLHRSELIINYNPKYDLCQCNSSNKKCRIVSREAKTE